MSDRAVISLQCGHYANHIGAHFWNFQESTFTYGPNAKPSGLCHDVLYREGLTINKEVTFTPRLVSIDLKGALGTLPELGDLYEYPQVPKTEDLFWSGDTHVQKEEPLKKNKFLRELEQDENINVDQDKNICEAAGDGCSPEKQMNKSTKLYNLDREVSVWSDYLRARFHPKTNSILREYHHKNEAKPFDVFGLGQEAWREGEGDEIEDRIRYFAEEADAVQGFQLVMDDYSGFGGLGHKLSELLADDYPSKALLVFPTAPSFYDEFSVTANSSRFLNTILSLQSQTSCHEQSLVTPMSLNKDSFVLPGQNRTLKRVNYDPKLAYHSSGILAAALDTMSLPFRGMDKHAGMLDITSGLNTHGRRVASASVLMPLALGRDQYVVNYFENDDWLQNLTSITPGCHDLTTEIRLQAVCIRGLDKGYLRPQDYRKSQKYSGHPYLNCEDTKSVVQHCLGMKFRRTINAVTGHDSALKVEKPFPRLFDQSIDASGHMDSAIKRDPETKGVDQVAVLTCWQSSKGTGDHVNTLYERAKKINLHKMHRFGEAGLEADDYDEVLSDLANLKDCYTETDLM